MAVNINVPSQVKTYANLAAFPASGALKTIYIAEDTNKTYRWTGSVYTEISATAASTWGAIGGTLSNQTDLQTALNAKQNSLGYTPVPETRTLTINGTTQDLSADRTFTISTGITIGTTAITSGTVGRVLFEGTGNVVQESANLFWDNTNGRLGIGTAAPTVALDVNSFINFRSQIRGIAAGGDVSIFGNNSSNVNDATRIILRNQNDGSLNIGNRYPSSGFISFECGNNAYTERMRIFQTGNVAINTTTDAGFRLDVNGTARVQGNTNVIGNIAIGSGVGFLTLSGAPNNNVIQGNQSIEYRSVGTTAYRAYHNFTNNSSFTPTVDFIPHVIMGATFAPTSGTGSYAQLLLQPTINQTGGANGITRGLHITPTLTSAADFRAIETTAGRVIFGGLPTSSAGLPTGAIWNDAGTLKIV